MNHALQDSIIVLTGASQGIGKAVALTLAKDGAKLVLAARDRTALEDVAKEVQSLGGSPDIIPTDVTDPEACKHLIEQTLKRHQRIDVLILNAGISMRALFEDITPPDVKRIMDVNFSSNVHLTHLAIPALKASKGHIIVVSSILGKCTLPMLSAYCASKYALHGFFGVLRHELSLYGIHVGILCPGLTESKIRERSLKKERVNVLDGELGKSMTAEAVALHLRDMILKRKREVLLTSKGIFAVKFATFFPGFFDFVVAKIAKRKNILGLK